MSRKMVYFVSSMLVLGLCLTPPVHAANIIWVSDGYEVDGVKTDQGFIDVLTNQGHEVDYQDPTSTPNVGYWRELDSAKIAALNSADLIIISRLSNSGDYANGSEPSQWNSVSTPIIMLTAYICRSNRWQWLDTTGTPEGSPMLQAMDPGHPVFTDVALDQNNQVSVLTATSNFPGTADPGNGVLLANRADSGEAWIVTWNAGQQYYPGSGHTAGGRRMYLTAGQTGDTNSPEIGRYNLTAEGEQIFINAVDYMLGILKRVKAYGPDPADGAEDVSAPLTRWTPGETAAFHDVYFGTNPEPGSAEFRGRRNKAMTLYWHEPGLTPGTTYYWRIDEVEADGATIHTGDVWSFSTPPASAYEPDPPDGANYVSTEADLGWRAGFNAITHDVYFGTDEAAVVAGDPSVFQNNVDTESFDPGTLALETTYYWRIDEVEGDNVTKHEGEVWSFTTIPDIPISDPNLVVWWKFDEGWGTTALDWSGHGDHGSLTNGPQWAFGYDGDALHFDGVDDQVLGASVTLPTDAFTIAFWFNSDSDLDSSSPREDFVYWQTGSRPHITFDKSGTGEIGFWPNIGGDFDGPLTTTNSWSADTWYHIAGTFDGTNFKIHVNGNLENTVNHAGTHADASGLIIGSRPTDSFFDGMIDDVRIYNRALTPEEIQQAMRGDPLLAWDPSPINRSTPDIERAIPLSWKAGDNAAQHDVYFGADRDAVENADTSAAPGIYRGRQSFTSYMPPEALQWGQTYYWRIDEYNTDTSISTGRLWSFNVAEYLIVDDFEDYNDYTPDRIWQTWRDGYGYNEPPPGYDGNGSGSQVGNDEQPFTEQTTVHSGRQAMTFRYINDGSTGKALYSEAQREWAVPQDWTRKGVKALTLWFNGDAANSAERLYVGVQDSLGTRKDVPHENPSAVLLDDWEEWNIDLQEFANAGVNLASVKTMYIGVGNRLAPQMGGTGTLYFDDIRLYRPRCVPDEAKPAASFNDDCVVDYIDLQMLAADWLMTDSALPTAAPNPAGAWWKFENNLADSAGTNQATAHGSPTYGAGVFGQAMSFDGVDDYITVPDSAGVEFGTGSFSISLWIKSSWVGGSPKQFIICNGTNGSEFDAGGNGPDGRATGKRYVLKFEGGGDFRLTIDDDVTKTILNSPSDNFATGDWVHAVAVRDTAAGELRVYRNGMLESSGPDDTTETLDSPGEPLYIGAKLEENAHAANQSAAPVSHYFMGMLDELQLFKYALTEQQVRYLADSTPGDGELYLPIESPAELYDAEPQKSRSIDFKDYAVLADAWLDELLWP